MPELHFRFATRDDVSAVAALIESAYRGPDAAVGWTTETHLLTGPRSQEAEIAALVDDEGSRFVLAETAEGQAVGCALVQRVGDDAYFGMFAVDPHRQAAGVGRAVLTRCEEVARDLWGARSMSLSVISLRSELIDWYVRRGYERTGTMQPFPFHEHSGALRNDFALVQLRKPL